MKGITAHPLCWPEGWERTPAAKRMLNHRFKVSFAEARDGALRSLRLLGATDAVISSDIPVKRDGTPYARAAEPADPGIALYWTVDRQPRVIACDCWNATRDNMRAIGLTLEAFRQIERAGATEILGRAYAGFKALPEPARPSGGWREVLGFGPNDPVDALRLIRRWRQLALEHHPDVGGDPDQWLRIQRAYEDAKGDVSP